MKLQIVRRWGANQPGTTVTVNDPQQARWLLDNNFAVRSNQPETATSGAAAPGTHGPDIKAGGDPTRRYPSTRRGSREGNLAEPIMGSPTSYTAGVRDEAGGTASESDPESGQESGPSTKISGSGRKRKPDEA